MLLKYSFQNFRSFREEAEFSMKPGRKMERFEDNVINTQNGIRGLKTAVVFGENGGGKTNFIRSLDYFLYLFHCVEPIYSVKPLLNYNDATRKSIQKFSLQVFVENKMYFYELEMDGVCIIKEELDVSVSGKKKEQVFKLEREKYELEYENEDQEVTNVSLKCNLSSKYVGKEYKIMNDKINENFNGLFINKLALLDIEIVLPFCNWINHKLIIKSPSNISLAKYQQLKKDAEDLEILKKESLKEIFQLVDPSIMELVVDEEEPFKDTIIIRQGGNEQLYKTKISEESSGIQDFLAWSINIWKVEHQNATVFADEMDKVLNPLLAERIIAHIHGSEHSGQFIFSTHNILHLNTRNFMKQQLWIATKNKFDLSSEIYSLAEFEDFRYDKTELHDLYLKGILGGTIDG